MRLSVVMPVFNERQTFREILDQVQAVAIPPVPHERARTSIATKTPTATTRKPGRR